MPSKRTPFGGNDAACATDYKGSLESRPVDDSEVAFDERGLVPCIVQDWRTGEVLTLAYMNAEALRLTRETGEMHFFSRSRQELWHKGATSGNTPGGQGDPLRLRRRRAAGARRAGRARRATPASAPAFTAAS